jgi:hypothetical protein
MGTSTFRRSTKSERKQGGGKGQRGNWRESYRLPKAAPAPFCLIAGDYVDPDPSPDIVEIDVQTGQPLPVKLKYYKWLRHRMKGVSQQGKARIIDEPCARGWDKHNPQTCAGCFAIESANKAIGLGLAYSIGLVHLAVYHKHPVWNQNDSKWVTFKENGTYVMADTECTGKTCNFCRFLSGQPLLLRQNEFWPQYDPKMLSLVFGSRRYLELGSGHLGDLGEWDKQVGAVCGGTAWARNADGTYVTNAQGAAIPIGRCGAFLSVDGYACPTCNTMLINAETDPRSLQELDDLAQKKYPCHICQRPVFMKEIDSCEQCGQAVVNDLFDGVIWGQRQGEDTSSHMVNVKFETIEDFESKLPPDIRQLLGGKKLRERIEELSQSYNFADLYKPKAPEAMAKRLEITLPPGFGGATQPHGYSQPAPQQPYGQPQQPAYGQHPYQQQPPVVPAYTPYATPSGPGPAPFVPPQKPNFGN